LGVDGCALCASHTHRPDKHAGRTFKDKIDTSRFADPIDFDSFKQTAREHQAKASSEVLLRERSSSELGEPFRKGVESGLIDSFEADLYNR
jgi:hypothetical protein